MKKMMLGLVAVLALTVLLGQQAQAQTTYYWDANGATSGAGTAPTGTWGGGTPSAFWSTSATGVAATAATALTSADTAVFTAYDAAIPGNNPTGAYTVTLGAAQSVAGIVIGTAAANGLDGQLTLTGTGSPGITIGAGGVTLAGSSGDPSFSSNLGTVTLSADQTWAVNNAHAWTIASAVAGNATASNTRTWTLGFLNAFTNNYTGVISNGGAGGELALTVNNSGGGTQSVNGTANTYSGKTTVSRGILQFNSIKDVNGGSSSLGAVTTVANGTIDVGSGANSGGLYYNGGSASSSNRVINMAGTTGGATIKSINGTAANTLTLTGGITNAGGNKTLTLAGTNTGTNTISGVIADAPGATGTTTVTKSEAGFWSLNGPNTYTGGTNINAGTLFMGASGTLGNNVVGNNIQIAGGNLLLSAATNVGSNQTLTVTAAGGGIGVAYTPVSFPTVVDNSGSTGGVFGINYTGTGGIGSVAGIDAFFTASSNWSLGSFSGGSGTFTGSSLTAGSGSNYRLGGGGGTLTIQNNILTGANNLLAGSTGGGTVILPNGNTYTGTTTLRNGTLSVGSFNSVSNGTASSSLGAPSNPTNGIIAVGSGTNAVALNYTGGGETTDRVLNFVGTSGGVTLSNSGTGAINFNSTPTFTGTGSKTLTLGVVTDSVGGSIGAITDQSVTNKTAVTKNGLTNSTWVVNGASSYTGNTTVSGGVLQLANASNLSGSYITLSGANLRYAVLQTQGTLNRTLSGTAASTNLNWAAFSGFAAKGGALSLTMNGGTGLSWGAGNFLGTGTDPLVFGSTTSDNQVTLTNAINLNTNDAFNRVIYVEKGTGGDSALLSGVISQGVAAASNNGIVKDGKGTLILSGTNTYGGPTTIRSGTLVAGTNSLSGSSGAFGLGTGTTAAPTAPSAIQMGEVGTGNATHPSLLIGGAFTVSRALSVNNNGTNNVYSIGGSTDNDSTYSGAITLSNGGVNNNTFSVTQVATTGVNAFNITGGITGFANANTKTVNFDNVGAVNIKTAGISDGAGGGKVAVSKTNTGLTTLSTASSHTGGTTVSGGTLLVDASGSLTGVGATATVLVTGGTFNYVGSTALAQNVTVNGGNFKYNNSNAYSGTLTLTSGTVSGSGNLSSVALTIGTGAVLSPGNSPGTLASGATTYASGGTYLWEINALATSLVPGSQGANPGWDFQNITGGLDITATSGSKFTLQIDSLNALNNWNQLGTYQWTLATASGGITNFSADKFFIDTTAFQDQNPFTGAFSVSVVSNSLVLNYGAVPEPSTYALVLGGLGMLAFLRRRNSKVSKS